MFSPDSGFASSSKTHSVSWSFQDDVEVHAENTSVRVILNTQIDVLLNTETKISLIIIDSTCIREIGFSELSVLDFESSFENFIGFVASDCNVHGHFFISFNTEASDGESGSGGDGFLSCEIFQDL